MKRLLLAAVVLTCMTGWLSADSVDPWGLQIFDGTSCGTSDCVTILVNGSGTVFSGTNGIVTGLGGVGSPSISGGIGFASFSGGLGSNFSFDVNTGMTSPLLPGGPYQMDLTINNIATVGAGDLTILWSQSGIDGSNPPSGWNLLFNGNGKAPAGSGIGFLAYYDTSLFGFAGTIGSGINCTAADLSDSNGCTASTGGAVSVPNPFSLTELVKIHATGAMSVTGDAKLDPIATPLPEPSSLLLLGTGMLGLISVGRKKLFRI